MDKLILFTSSFPFGNKETYLETEIIFLAEVFDKVEIYPHYYNQGNKKQREVPNNVRVHTPAYPISKIGRLYLALKGLFKGAKGLLFFKEFFKFKVYKSSKNFLRWLFALFDYLATLGSPHYNRIKNEKQAVFYFYWGIGWSYVCLNINKEVTRKCFIRLHGGDAYLERANGYLPLRKEIFEKADYLLPISNDLKEYLHARFSILKEKILVSRLGVEIPDFNRNCLCDDTLKIVSCSNLIALKRVFKILEALKRMDGTIIEWTHFGDGPLLNSLKNEVDKLQLNTIRINLVGRIKNEKITAFYQNQSIDAFVNVSEYEGVPVSIMEAMSYGIPCIATNAGATSELVNGENGILLPNNFSIQELINSFNNIKSRKWREKSKLAYQHCKEIFNANNNYKKLGNLLIEKYKE
jgi:glycosyltransferase involved in cell wall biosynthesis